MEPEHLPRPQTDPAESGGRVLSAVGQVYGKNIDAAASEEAAEWMKNHLVLNPHFVWRGGAERQLAASEMPLREMQKSNDITSIDVTDLLDHWEAQQDSQTSKADG
jgi:hypothetical protein